MSQYTGEQSVSPEVHRILDEHRVATQRSSKCQSINLLRRRVQCAT